MDSYQVQSYHTNNNYMDNLLTHLKNKENKINDIVEKNIVLNLRIRHSSNELSDFIEIDNLDEIRRVRSNISKLENNISKFE